MNVHIKFEVEVDNVAWARFLVAFGNEARDAYAQALIGAAINDWEFEGLIASAEGREVDAATAAGGTK